MKDTVTCGSCDGTGEQDCDWCDGTGVDESVEPEVEEVDGVEVESEPDSCSHCAGSGTMDCWECDGTGEIEDDDDD